MKFQTFNEFLKEMIQYIPDIDLRTSKTIISNYFACLSDKEQEIYGLDLELILTTISKQISITTFVNDAKTEMLEQKLNTLKRDDKP